MTGFAALAMYGFEELRQHWDALYQSSTRWIPGAPQFLSWDHEVVQSWTDPGLVLGQTCGWPLVKTLSDKVAVVGAFTHLVCEAGRPEYRSVLIAREPAPVQSFVGQRAAINGFDSLSGCISLRSAFGSDWGEVVETGSHRASIHAVADDHADIASIDSVSWWHAQHLWPHEVASLFVIGHGPLVPCLPLIVPAATSNHVVTQWRSALQLAVQEQPDAAVALGITGFASLSLGDYQALLQPLQVFAQS